MMYIFAPNSRSAKNHLAHSISQVGRVRSEKYQKRRKISLKTWKIKEKIHWKFNRCARKVLIVFVIRMCDYISVVWFEFIKKSLSHVRRDIINLALDLQSSNYLFLTLASIGGRASVNAYLCFHVNKVCVGPFSFHFRLYVILCCDLWHKFASPHAFIHRYPSLAARYHRNNLSNHKQTSEKIISERGRKSILQIVRTHYT